MDNKKIGKLIADLRRKQGLTQQDLGDKVGVGFRAVSKWERGLTLPDISIINELSKILGITSDELLTGKINKETKSKEKRKLSNKIKITITIVTLIITVLSAVYIYFNNKTYVYNISSIESEKYYIKGNVIFEKDNISIIINEIKFKDSQFSKTRIKNYEYDIILDTNVIFRFGYDDFVNNLVDAITIQEFTKTFKINYNGTIRHRKIKKDLCLIMRFIDENNNVITKQIDLILNEAE